MDNLKRNLMRMINRDPATIQSKILKKYVKNVEEDPFIQCIYSKYSYIPDENIGFYLMTNHEDPCTVFVELGGWLHIIWEDHSRMQKLSPASIRFKNWKLSICGRQGL